MSSYKIYVGNLPFSTDEKELTEMFTQAGEVVLAKIVRNTYNNKSKGYGFVEMGKQQDANNAITMFHNKEVNGRQITVEKGKKQGQAAPKFDKKRPMVQSHTNA